MEHLRTIRKLVRRVRWRLKLQAAIHFAVIALTVASFVLAGVILFYKGLLIRLEVVETSAIACGGLVVAAFLAGLFRRVGEVEAASMLDEAGGFHDRLGSAVAFSAKRDQTPFMQAAITDAANVVPLARPNSAAPWALPVGLGMLALAIAATSVTVVVDFPLSQKDGRALAPLVRPGGPSCQSARLRKEDRKRLADEVEKLKEELQRTEDQELKDWIAELNKLIRDLQEGKITPKQAFARMAALEKAKEEWKKEVTEGLEKVTKKIKKAAAKKKKSHKELEKLLEAMREQRLKDAAKSLEKLAKKTKKGELSKRDRKHIAKDLKQLAEALKSERQRQMDKLKKERDRLRKKREKQKDRFSRKNRDRLKRNKRQLEQLRRERQQMSEARRQLEKLQRSLSQAAQDMLRRLQQKAGQQDQQKMTAEQMKRAAEMMRRLEQAAKSGKSMRVAEGRIIDIKEMLRRAGKQGKDGKDGKGGKGGKMDQFYRLAQGKGGKPGGKGGKEGKEGKGGQEGKSGPKLLKPGGKGGKDGDMLLLGGKGDKPGGVPLPTPGRSESGPGAQPGEGIGDGHDPHLKGAKERMKTKTKEDFVAGQQGKGESQSRVLMTAAQKGFASRQYRKVHQDYRHVVEEAMERQEIPAGKRRYVRRYFDLIRPQ